MCIYRGARVRLELEGRAAAGDAMILYFIIV